MDAKSYIVRGMTCAACSARVEKVTKAVAGVQKVEVNLLGGTMVVEAESDSVSVSGFITELLGKFPEVGDIAQFENLNMEVTKVDSHCAENVRVTRIAEDEE